MSIEDNKAAVSRIFEEVWNQGKVAVLDELCAPNFILHETGEPDVLTREDLKPYVTQHHSTFPDLHFTIEDMIAEGEQVVVRYTVHGTNTGDFVLPDMRIPATGKQITVTGIYIAHFTGGKVVEAWDQMDTLGLYQQLGMIPAPQSVG